MRPFWSACLVIGASIMAVSSSAAGEQFPLVAEASLPAVAERALTDLQQVLRGRGLQPMRQPSLPPDGSMAMVIGTAGTTTVDRLLDTHRIALPKTPESLCIRKLHVGAKT